jgi:hypothetical protein
LEALVSQKTRELADFEGDLGLHELRIAELFRQLEAAAERSSLPETVPNRSAIDEYLVRLRLSGQRRPDREG